MSYGGTIYLERLEADMPKRPLTWPQKAVMDSFKRKPVQSAPTHIINRDGLSTYAALIRQGRLILDKDNWTLSIPE